MDDFDEAKIEFELQAPNESVQALARAVPYVMASACEDETSLCSKLLKVQQVRSVDVSMDSLLRIDYEFWTSPSQFKAVNPEHVIYRCEHIYVRSSVLMNNEIYVRGMGHEFGFEEWFQDDFIEGTPEETSLPAEGYAALLQEVTHNHLNAIAEFLVDDEESLPQGIHEDMQRLYHSVEMARREADKVWEEQESIREAERQQSNPTWDPLTLQFVQDAEKITLCLYSPERQFNWIASVTLLSNVSSPTIRLSKAKKVPSPLNYVPISQATIKAPHPISQETAEAELRDLFASGWLPLQFESLK